MSGLRRAALVVAVLAAAGSAGLGAQEHGGRVERPDHQYGGAAGQAAGPRVLVHRPGARAMGLGGSFWAAERNDAAIFHHPALLGGAGFGAEYAHLADGTAFVSASASGEWFGGTVGIGLSFADAALGLDRRAFGGTPEHGSRGGRRGERWGSPDGDFAHGGSSFALAAGFAADVWDLRAGGVAKVAGLSGLGDRHAAVALDLGAAMDAGPIALALSVQNLGLGLAMGEVTVPLPTRAVLGASTDREPVGPFDIGASVHAALDREADLSGGGGIEAAWWPVAGRVFVARGGFAAGGVHGAGFTFGAGFVGDRILLDYGHGRGERGEPRHVVSLAFR